VSGIAGLVVPEGRTVDDRLLQRMAASMAHRGPDGLQTWRAGRVGFAHALLRTSDVAPAPQPATLDNRVWITADARIDGSADLVDKLERAGRAAVADADDSQLILHAYHAWGEHCVDHLIGDFAFAIWDSRRQRLFCARDHFGVKPFFYAEVDGGVVFSNTLDCVRLHPAVGDTLNELSIADFLLFGFNHDTSATAFARVRRLPPAHTLVIGAGTPARRRYWALPVDGRIRYRRSADYVDRFSEILRDAVADRIRDTRPAVWLSGGLDSTTIAATAQQLVAARAEPFPLRAFTVGYESLFHDEEPRYAETAARAIGLSFRFLPADACQLFDGWDRSGIDAPEPIDDPFNTLRTRQLEEVAAGGRVALAGDGGDEIFWRPYLLDLIGTLSLRDVAAGLTRCVLLHGRRPAVGLRAKVGEWRRRRSPHPELPAWLPPDFVARCDLRQRFARAEDRSAIGSQTPRPEVHRRLSSPFLYSFLEGHDPGITRVPLDHRWPFLDVRLVSYLLAVPPVPWCVDKRLLRVAMRGVLPEVILRRSKSPLAGDPVRAHLQTSDVSWIDGFEPAPGLSQFVNRLAVPSVASLAAADDPWMDLRPLCLNYWLGREQSRCRKGESS
jgi:asparagine synthase (glutamine-hydrolysing)